LAVAILACLSIRDARRAADASKNDRRRGGPRYRRDAQRGIFCQPARSAPHQILVQADSVLCDGKPLVGHRSAGNSLPARVGVPICSAFLLERAAQRGWKIFLLVAPRAPGPRPPAGSRGASKLPPVAHYSPPYAPLAQMNHAESSRGSRAAKPDLLLVCFGCPKQEKWIFQHYRALACP